eukprot:TRINITY_DN27765_c0_g1_i1.p1 TRINITY_DN27765_c0_g1~~TRINITY_DN27765_c0_g1_i1.p1  ORF type:complete len:495 (+),score=61.78 TRINITY_DN27765_c0_g1_i1:24-1487(+)
MHTLTPAHLLNFCRCPKLLHLQFFRPQDAAAPVASVFDARKVREHFQSGYAVGSGAVNVSAETGDVFEQSQNARAAAKVVVNPVVAGDGISARADVAVRLPGVSEAWHLKFVQARVTDPKEDNHALNLAIRLHAFRSAGWPVQRVSIVRLNRFCRYPNLKKLFTETDVTASVLHSVGEVADLVKRAQSVLQQPEAPKTAIGPQCEKPERCSFAGVCWQHVPKGESVFDIYRMQSQTRWDHYKNGRVHMRDLPTAKLTPLQRRMVQCTLSGKSYVDRKTLQQEVAKWKGPLTYLDFEYQISAIPQFPGMAPFDPLPFQFSCHVEQPDGSLEHHYYLHESQDDPRPAVTAALLQAVPNSGSIVAYHKPAETSAIRALSANSAEHSEELDALVQRLVDPLPLLRQCVYNRLFNGSFSLKRVAPALLGTGYSEFAVQGGASAIEIYNRYASLPEGDPMRRVLRDNLLEYCGADTRLLAALVNWMRNPPAIN